MKAASTERQDYISYPTNRVVGTVGDDGKAKTAIDALLRAGFARHDIDILHDEKDLKRLDPTGAEHGFFAQFQRTLIRALDLEEFKHLTHHVDDVRAGRFVIMVLAKRRAQRIVAADILHRHGADFVEFYGRWACEDLPSTAQRSPEEIPALFAQAWNDRDPDALASLFDEDAEFVNVTGVCWHDRASIRKAHAYGLERIFNHIDPGDRRDEGPAAVTGHRRGARAHDAFLARHLPVMSVSPDHALRSCRSCCIGSSIGGSAHRRTTRT